MDKSRSIQTIDDGMDDGNGGNDGVEKEGEGEGKDGGSIGGAPPSLLFSRISLSNGDDEDLEQKRCLVKRDRQLTKQSYNGSVDNSEITYSNDAFIDAVIPEDYYDGYVRIPTTTTDTRHSSNSTTSVKYGISALVATCLLSIGSHYAAHMLNALKSTLKEELQISNKEYGALQSSVAVVSSFVPLLGGIMLDRFGTVMASFIASSLITYGEFTTAFATEIVSFKCMIFGRMLYGLGAGSIVTVQETILAHWFHGKGLGIALGIQLSLSRLSSFMAMVTVLPLRDFTHSYKAAFWISAFICLFSWFANIFYIFLVHLSTQTVSEEQREDEERRNMSRRRSFHIRETMQFPLSYFYILLVLFFLGGCWAPFLHVSTEMLHIEFDYPDTYASFLSSIPLFLPIFLSPIFGYMIEKKHKYRTILKIVSCLSLCSGFAILLITRKSDKLLNMYVIMALSLIGISLASGPISLISSIPPIIQNNLGTALGMYKVVLNVSAMVMDPLLGLLQDLDEKNGYGAVLWTLLVMAALACVLGVVKS